MSSFVNNLECCQANFVKIGLVIQTPMACKNLKQLTTTNSCLSKLPSLSISAKSQIFPKVSTGNFESISSPLTWKNIKN